MYCLTLQRRPVPIAQGTVTNAALAGFLGYPESATQQMFIAAWLRLRVGALTDVLAWSKGTLDTHGVRYSLRAQDDMALDINRSGANATQVLRRSARAWTHTACVINRDGFMQIYTNGLLAAQRTSAGFTSGEHWAGTPVDLVVNFDQANIREFVFGSTNVSGRVIASPTQILALARRNELPPNVLYWPADEGRGTVCRALYNGQRVSSVDMTLASDAWSVQEDSLGT